jgi:tRNA (cytidine32/uridine32-2'-O)-methyltransferase
MLANIRIVLVNTFHPGNIGAAARAMKNMGLSNLYLVEPREFPSEEANSRAAGAVEMLQQATVVNSLEQAIGECALVIGASARNRSFPRPMLDAQSCADKAVHEAKRGPVAIVFGRERTGLTNEELELCQFHAAIPADPNYPVLNVSAALQVISYEIWQAHSAQQQAPESIADIEYPTQEEMGYFYQHLEQTLREVGFLSPQHEGNSMTRLQRLYNRARPEKSELNMLRGILSGMQKHLK